MIHICFCASKVCLINYFSLMGELLSASLWELRLYLLSCLLLFSGWCRWYRYWLRLSPSMSGPFREDVELVDWFRLDSSSKEAKADVLTFELVLERTTTFRIIWMTISQVMFIFAVISSIFYSKLGDHYNLSIAEKLNSNFRTLTFRSSLELS